MEIPTRAGREAVELLTEAEATAFINNDKETIETELNRLTFVPLAPRPADEPTFTAAEVAVHATPHDCWVIVHGGVFDVRGEYT